MKKMTTMVNQGTMAKERIEMHHFQRKMFKEFIEMDKSHYPHRRQCQGCGHQQKALLSLLAILMKALIVDMEIHS